MRAMLLAFVLLLAVTPPAVAQSSGLPALTAPVNDAAGVIDAGSARELDARIRALRNATGDVVIVATVPTIAPYATVEEYAVKLFERAGIGDKKLDNGLLILVAVKEHGIRIEVGYGLEGFVTDGFAGDTIRQAIAPEFKAGRYGAGLLAGTTRLIDRINAGRQGTPAAAPENTSGSLVLGVILFLVLCAGALGIILFLISRIAKATGGARATPSSGGVLGSGSNSSNGDGKSRSSSSSSDSDFSGFGGGSSGGGGASGSW